MKVPAIYINNLIKAELVEKYQKSINKLVLLDYDGTLVNYAPTPDKARPSEHLIDILVKLVDNPKTKVFIISGRGHLDIDKLLGHLSINFVAEHGAFIKENGVWEEQIIDNGVWKKTVIPILNQISLTCPNSFIEEKHFSLTWHYRNSDQQSGYDHSRKLISILENIIHSYNLKILDGNKSIEIISREIGKGKAVKKLLEQNNYDFILSIGDDVTDEEMFEFLLHNTDAYTVKVGNGSTFAKYKLDRVNDVVIFLKHLSE